MRRLVIVLLFVITSVMSWAPGVSAQSDDLPDAPQSESGNGLAFSIEAAFRGDDVDALDDVDAPDDDQEIVFVSLTVENSGNEPKLVNADRFTLDGEEDAIESDVDIAETAADALDLEAMSDILPSTVRAGNDAVFLLAWAVPASLDETVLTIDYGDAEAIDIQPWIDLDIDVADLGEASDRTATTDEDETASASPSRRASSSPRATATAIPDVSDDELTADEEDYIGSVLADAVILGNTADDLADLFGLVQFDETLLFDPVWQAAVNEQLNNFRAVDGRAQLLAPSNRQASIQEIWLSLTGYTADAADYYTFGLANFDAGSIGLGNASLQSATNLIDDLTSEITAFRDDPASFGSASSGGSTTGNGGAGASGVDGPVADCSAFATYEQAQAYYADHPEEQPTIDPDVDGLACEVYFGRG